MDMSSNMGLEWENLALYNAKPIDVLPDHHHLISASFDHFATSKYHQDDYGKMDHDYTSTRYDDFMRMHTHTIVSSSSSEPLIGLRLGTQKDCLGGGVNVMSSKSPIDHVSSTPTKRSRASYHNMQNPCCQVEGCNLDLKSAKDYHRRHRICETHSKSPKVVVAGKERRFCQQCSRFHDLSEFDDKKRSCRRRLSDHNARRRRVQPESIQLTSTGLSSASYDQRQQNVLLSGLPISLSNSTWENAAASTHAFLRPSKPRGLDGVLSFPSDDIHHSISNLHMDPDKLSIHASNPRVLDQCVHVHSTSPSLAPDLMSAHSLLSSNTWSMNDGESSSMEGLVHGNYSQVMRQSDSESNPLSLFHAPPPEQGPPPPLSLIHSLNLHHNEASSHHQEYQLFKAPYDSDAFYSSQRYL